MNKICIDENNRTVYFSYYSLMNGKKDITRSFDEVKTEIRQYQWPKFFRKPKIYFFKTEPGDLYISAEKDGFSNKSMTELVKIIESLTVPVKK